MEPEGALGLEGSPGKPCILTTLRLRGTFTQSKPVVVLEEHLMRLTQRRRVL